MDILRLTEHDRVAVERHETFIRLILPGAAVAIDFVAAQIPVIQYFFDCLGSLPIADYERED
jgi:hypothetical protein